MISKVENISNFLNRDGIKFLLHLGNASTAVLGTVLPKASLLVQIHCQISISAVREGNNESNGFKHSLIDQWEFLHR